jgi:hypothetical protein
MEMRRRDIPVAVAALRQTSSPELGRGTAGQDTAIPAMSSKQEALKLWHQSRRGRNIPTNLIVTLHDKDNMHAIDRAIAEGGATYVDEGKSQGSNAASRQLRRGGDHP